jgi:hypothetical protein
MEKRPRYIVSRRQREEIVHPESLDPMIRRQHLAGSAQQ